MPSALRCVQNVYLGSRLIFESQSSALKGISYIPHSPYLFICALHMREEWLYTFVHRPGACFVAWCTLHCVPYTVNMNLCLVLCLQKCLQRNLVWMEFYGEMECYRDRTLPIPLWSQLAPLTVMKLITTVCVVGRSSIVTTMRPTSIAMSFTGLAFNKACWTCSSCIVHWRRLLQSNRNICFWKIFDWWMYKLRTKE